MKTLIALLLTLTIVLPAHASKSSLGRNKSECDNPIYHLLREYDANIKSAWANYYNARTNKDREIALISATMYTHIIYTGFKKKVIIQSPTRKLYLDYFCDNYKKVSGALKSFNASQTAKRLFAEYNSCK